MVGVARCGRAFRLVRGAGGAAYGAPGAASSSSASSSDAEEEEGALVERFDRRGIEPFELFRSEFGQNSGTVTSDFSC